MDSLGDRSLRDLVHVQATRYGDRTFLVHETAEGELSQLSFVQLHEQTIKLATYFESIGLKKGDRVFVFLRNTPEFVPIWFGLTAAGLVMVPGNIYLTEPEVQYQLEHCEPSAVITEARFVEVIGQAIAATGKAISRYLDADIVLAALNLPIELSVDLPDLVSSDLAQILYTSGTSAKPKGVMLTHANFLWAGFASALHSQFIESDRVFNNKPLFHANCQDTVMSCLTVGATVIIGERYSATRYLAQLVRHQATVCSLSGMLCRTLLNQPESELDRAHQIRFGAYAINISEQEIRRFTERFGIRLRNGYGQSEAMLYISYASLSEPSTYPSIGRPCLEREVFIVDDNNQILDAGEVGEIVVRGRRGRNLMVGYYRDDQATDKAFEGGWLHTGDTGYFDELGNLYFFGRKKDVIKRSGENISAAEVEEVIISHEAVADVAVVGVPDPVRDQAVLAYVVLQPSLSLDESEIRTYCEKRLAYFKVPSMIRFVDGLPRNASGKVLKRELTQRYAHG